MVLVGGCTWWTSMRSHPKEVIEAQAGGALFSETLRKECDVERAAIPAPPRSCPPTHIVLRPDFCASPAFPLPWTGRGTDTLEEAP